MSAQTVTINGTHYDIHTGLPIDIKSNLIPASQVQRSPRQSHDIHRRTQKSQTLNRRIVATKVAPSRAVDTMMRPKTQLRSPHVISKFAPHPAAAIKKPAPVSDIAPSAHPAEKRAHVTMAEAAKNNTRVSSPPQASSVLRREAETIALHSAPSHRAHKAVKVPARKSQRIMSVLAVTFAFLVLGGYFTYLNMPGLSVRVAAAQAGVDASYPGYRPDGYSLSGPVAYDEGQVSMKFASNAGPQNYIIKQEQSTWDSTAVKENYVETNWGDNIDIVTEQGLTIYRQDGNAIWVNGGVLYTINGDAPLTSSQIRSIATSL